MEWSVRQSRKLTPIDCCSLFTLCFFFSDRRQLFLRIPLKLVYDILFDVNYVNTWTHHRLTSAIVLHLEGIRVDQFRILDLVLHLPVEGMGRENLDGRKLCSYIFWGFEWHARSRTIVSYGQIPLQLEKACSRLFRSWMMIMTTYGYTSVIFAFQHLRTLMFLNLYAQWHSRSIDISYTLQHAVEIHHIDFIYPIMEFYPSSYQAYFETWLTKPGVVRNPLWIWKVTPYV